MENAPVQTPQAPDPVPTQPPVYEQQPVPVYDPYAAGRGYYQDNYIQRQAPADPGYAPPTPDAVPYDPYAVQGRAWQQGYRAPSPPVSRAASSGKAKKASAIERGKKRSRHAMDDRRGSSNNSKFLRTALIAAISVIFLAAAVWGGSVLLKRYRTEQYVSPYNNVFVPGVYVDGIALGGMTADEGVAAVTAQAQSRSSSWSVNLTYHGQTVTTITADQLGMTVDVIDVLQEAWNLGHTGSSEERRAVMEQLLAQPYEGFTAVPSGNTAVVDDLLEQIRAQIYLAPQNAEMISFDPSQSYPFTFREDTAGRVLNVAPLKEQLYHMMSSMESGDVEIVPDQIQPTVTVADLKQHYAMRSSVYTPISSHSTTERTNNIRRSFESISGYILQPGKQFSFNGVVGQRTAKNGFSPAIEYAYGTEVMGIGGGVCQASTTVYQAAVVAGLEILHREPHSDSVSYTSYGQDATVYWEGKRKIDLTFRNNTESPLYFVASVDTDPTNRKRLIARVTIYGDSLGDTRYELTSETLEVLSPPSEPKYIKDKEQKYVTYTDQEKSVSKAKEGYVVRSYRLKYTDNQLVDTSVLYTDRYEPKAETIYVGTKSRD